MRVRLEAIGRKGTYLGGGGMVDAIGISTGRGCRGVGHLIVNGF